MPKATFHNLPLPKRARIIEAAVEEFASCPYEIANLDRVVERAGISKGSLYQYFDGKADLYRWLLTEHLPGRKLAAIGQSMPGPQASVWDILEQAFRAGVAFAIAEPGLSRLGVRFLRDNEVEPELAVIADAHRAAADAWLTSLLREAVARGEVREDLDVPVACGLLAHALGEGMLEQFARRLGITLAALLDSPHRIRELSDDDLTALVGSVLNLFRRGAAVSLVMP